MAWGTGRKDGRVEVLFSGNYILDTREELARSNLFCAFLPSLYSLPRFFALVISRLFHCFSESVLRCGGTGVEKVIPDASNSTVSFASGERRVSTLTPSKINSPQDEMTLPLPSPPQSLV
jgi:hypothetical protein